MSPRIRRKRIWDFGSSGPSNDASAIRTGITMQTIWTCSKTSLAICIALLSCLAIAGQDLGTSNKLFGKKKTVRKLTKKDGRRSNASASAAKLRAAKTREVQASKRSPVRIAPRREQVIFGRTPVRTAPLWMRETQKMPPPAAPTTVDPAAIRQYEQILIEANAELAARHYLAAENGFRRAIDLKCPDARAAMALGGLYRDTERWEAAERAYRTAIQREPQNAAAYLGLSYVLVQPVSSGKLSDRYSEAERTVRKAIELGGENAVVLDHLGAVLERQGFIGAETESAYRRAITIEPAYAPAYAHLDRLLSRRGLVREASDAYVMASSRANDAQMIVAVAKTLLSEQRFRDAVPLLRRALERDPRNARVLILLGRAVLGTNEFSDAEKYLLMSTNVSPMSFAGYSLLGGLYLRQGRLEDAERTLQLASTVADIFEVPILVGQFEDAGDLFLRDGRRADAERVYRKALALDPARRSLVSKIAKSRR